MIGDGKLLTNAHCVEHDTQEVQEETAKETDADMSSRKLGIDHFDNEESNPIKSKAMKSSLWEIDTLRHHYCPPVSRFVLSLENDLTVRAKTTEMTVQDFSSGSYATIFGDEGVLVRRIEPTSDAHSVLKEVSLSYAASRTSCTLVALLHSKAVTSKRLLVH
ncbi:hypothetical protein RGQ29_008028 [Quercus rubra]|uniref:CCAAT-binding factor domain-containing protein n=1 Tax=Quercus rubra TaxID=3512 RepID=A0AAN7DZ84_QUERU|nr:hypothetical protein RGQ29_008028 [Quercus rubra]